MNHVGIILSEECSIEEIDMKMFCYQCQETVKNTGCTIREVCGKTPETSGIQDLLICTLKGSGLACEGVEDEDI